MSTNQNDLPALNPQQMLAAALQFYQQQIFLQIHKVDPHATPENPLVQHAMHIAAMDVHINALTQLLMSKGVVTPEEINSMLVHGFIGSGKQLQEKPKLLVPK